MDDVLRVTLAFFLLLVAPASAGTLTVDGTVLRYTGAPGETNDMDMSSDGSFVQIGDTAGVTAGPGCTQVGAAARCSLAGVGSFVVSLGTEMTSREASPGSTGASRAARAMTMCWATAATRNSTAVRARTPSRAATGSTSSILDPNDKGDGVDRLRA